MAEISKSNTSNAIYFLQGLLGVGLSEEELETNKSFYNQKFSTVANLYGFKDFDTMYKYCKDDINSAEFIQKATTTNNALTDNGSNGKSKEKDTSDLVLSTKTGTRNGKPYTSRYWTDPKKANKDKSVDDDDTDESMQTTVDGLYLGGNKFGNPLPTTKNNSKPPTSWEIAGTYKKGCFDFIYALAHDDIVFMSGLDKTNDIISIKFASAPNEKDLLGRIHTLLSKVIKEAWLADYGVSFNPMMFIKYLSIEPFCETFGMKLKKGNYVLTAKQLQDILGDSACFRLL